MQRVLLLGDSIRMFYQEKVQENLGSEYEVLAPKENCRFSLYVLNSLRFWLEEFPSPDIICWNVGLWDMAILYHEDGCFVSLGDYVRNMKQILRELKKTGAVIIFSTTTPVADEKYKLSGPMPPAHRNDDIIRYNNAVVEAFRNENIIINDLHKLMYADKEKYLSDDMIHPNDEGVQLLSNAVAEIIKSQTLDEKKVKKDGKNNYLHMDEKIIQ